MGDGCWVLDFGKLTYVALCVLCLFVVREMHNLTAASKEEKFFLTTKEHRSQRSTWIILPTLSNKKKLSKIEQPFKRMMVKY